VAAVAAALVQMRSKSAILLWLACKLCWLSSSLMVRLVLPNHLCTRVTQASISCLAGVVAAHLAELACCLCVPQWRSCFLTCCPCITM
jgi:hypothetical protein